MSKPMAMPSGFRRVSNKTDFLLSSAGAIKYGPNASFHYQPDDSEPQITQDQLPGKARFQSVASVPEQEDNNKPQDDHESSKPMPLKSGYGRVDRKADFLLRSSGAIKYGPNASFHYKMTPEEEKAQDAAAAKVKLPKRMSFKSRSTDDDAAPLRVKRSVIEVPAQRTEEKPKAPVIKRVKNFFSNVRKRMSSASPGGANGHSKRTDFSFFGALRASTDDVTKDIKEDKRASRVGQLQVDADAEQDRDSEDQDDDDNNDDDNDDDHSAAPLAINSPSAASLLKQRHRHDHSSGSSKRMSVSFAEPGQAPPPAGDAHVTSRHTAGPHVAAASPRPTKSAMKKPGGGTDSPRRRHHRRRDAVKKSSGRSASLPRETVGAMKRKKKKDKRQVVVRFGTRAAEDIPDHETLQSIRRRADGEQFVAKKTAYEWILHHVQQGLANGNRKAEDGFLAYAKYKDFVRRHRIPRRGRVDALHFSELMRNARAALDVVSSIVDQIEDTQNNTAPAPSSAHGARKQGTKIKRAGDRKQKPDAGVSSPNDPSEPSQPALVSGGRRRRSRKAQAPRFAGLVTVVTSHTDPSGKVRFETNYRTAEELEKQRTERWARRSKREAVQQAIAEKEEEEYFNNRLVLRTSDDEDEASLHEVDSEDDLPDDVEELPQWPPPRASVLKRQGTPHSLAFSTKSAPGAFPMSPPPSMRPAIKGSASVSNRRWGVGKQPRPSYSQQKIKRRPGSRSRLPKIITSSSVVSGSLDSLLIKSILRQDQEVQVDAGAKSREKAPRRKPQFGLSIEEAEKEMVDTYENPIPAVLVELQQYMLANGGYYEQGIFRHSPKTSEVKEVQRQVDEGTFKSCDSVHTVATLFKKWFAEMPTSLFSALSAGDIEEAARSKASMARVVADMREPHRSVFLWLLDFLVVIQFFVDQNGMSAENLAVVFAPNLYDIPDSSQVTSAAGIDDQWTHLDMVKNFLVNAIDWRRSEAAPRLAVFLH